MKLDYIYHSGFAIGAEGVTLIIDYYKDSSETERNRGVVHDYLLQKPGKLYVLSTHFHPDHFNREILTWKEQRPDIIYIFSKDILKHRRAKQEDAIYINKGESYEDDALRIDAFGSTDVGISFLIHLQGMHIFHAGDLNNWHWNEEVPCEEAVGYEKAFLQELSLLAAAYPHFDAAMFPVDPRLGKDYMRGAQQFVDAIEVDHFIPMHFGEHYDKANAFAPYAHHHFFPLHQRGQAMTLF